MTAVDKFKREVCAVLRRWELESDIPEDELAIQAMEVVDEFLEAKGKSLDVDFCADQDLEDLINEDDGEHEETGDDI